MLACKACAKMATGLDQDSQSSTTKAIGLGVEAAGMKLVIVAPRPLPRARREAQGVLFDEAPKLLP